MKTQKNWQHKTHIPTWPQSAMAEQVLPLFNQTYLVFQFATVATLCLIITHPTLKECMSIAIHIADIPFIYSLYRYVSHALR